VSDQLSAFYGRIQQELGFGLPRLRLLDETLTFKPNSLSSYGYTAYIEPSNTGHCSIVASAAYYDIKEGRLVLCYNSAIGLDPFHIRALQYFYFNATEYGYQAVYTEFLVGVAERWIIEGMAMAAEESYYFDFMRRYTGISTIVLHKADTSLKSPSGVNEYEAQDFWVYYGQHYNQGLAYLDNVLASGAQATDIARTLGSNGLLPVYWDWVKNHLEEPVVTYDNQIGTPCQLETQVVDHLEQFDYTWNIKPYHDVTLGPLSSIVVDVRWDYKYDYAYGIVFAVLGQPAGANLALEYKLYQEGENSCETIPDGERRYVDPDPGKRYYVVVTNTSPTEAYTYRVGFENTPLPPR
jgi:hypothetical protein